MKGEWLHRQLVRLFPSAWRARNEAALLETLRADPDRSWRNVAGDAVDLAHRAMQLRLRSLRSPVISSSAIAVAVVALAVALLRRSHVPAAFVFTSLAVAAVPGTGVLFTMSSTLRGGARRGMLAALGCTLGIVPHIVIAAVGLSGVMQAGATLFEVIRWAGAIYLVIMGASLIRTTDDVLGGSAATSAEIGAAAIIRRAILLNLLNPKLTLFFFAFMPQFLDRATPRLDRRYLVLALVFMAATLAVFALYAMLSSVLRERVLRTPTMRRRFQRFLGAAIVGLGIKLGASTS